MSIRIKLLLILFTFTFIPLSLLSILAINNTNQTIEHEVENALNNLVDEKVGLIHEYLLEKEHHVKILANLPMVANALESLTTVFAQGVTSPAYLSEDMAIRPTLRQLKEQFNAYDLFLIAANGDIIFTVIHEDDFATNLITGPYRETLLASSFERSASLLESSVSRFEPYTPSQKSIILPLAAIKNELQGQEAHSAFVSAPVFNESRFLGVVAIQLNSNDYYHLATDYTGIGRTGEIVISKLEDNHAVIIAPLRRDPSAAFNLRYLIGSEIARPIQSSVLGDKGSGVSIGYEDTEILAAWRYIPELQWGMVVKIETAEAFADAIKLEQILILLGFGIMFLAMLVAMYFSNKLSAPLVALIKATEGIMKGDYNQKISIQTFDEVGQLGSSFNRMSTKLRQSLDERDHAEQALHEAHDTLEIRIKERTAEREQVTAELTQLIDTANAPIFGIDEKGLVNEWNQQAAIITGFSKKEVMGHDLVENYITEDYKEPVKQVLDNALKGEELANYEFPLYTKDGKRIEVLLNATTRRDMDGNITGVIGIGQDITEAKLAQAERELVSSELTQLINTANAPIFGIDTEGKVNEWNKQAVIITGFSKEDVIGHDLVENYIAENYKTPVKQVLDNALKGEDIANYEFPLYTKDGKRIEILLNATTRRDMDGNISGVIGIGQDITERVRSESELRRSETLLSTSQSIAHIGSWELNLIDDVFWWTDEAIQILGISQDTPTLNFESFFARIHPDDRDWVKESYLESLQDHTPFEVTHRIEHPSQGIRWVHAIAETTYNTDGTPLTTIGTLQDLTDIRAKENALNQAQKMEAVGQLTGGIAHDFNNLLSIISGNLRFLQQDIGQSTVEINELFEDAMSAVDDGAELTQRLLGFSRSRTLQPEIKNVNDTIEKFTRFLSRTLAVGIELDTNLPDENLFISIDPSQLENALLNLTINARDAMPNGGKITISAERYHQGDGDGDGDGDKYSSTLTEGDHIKISVTDTGTGIKAEDLAHVYEPFFTTKEVGKGSGLGLSMVYGFTQQSNGACHIDSTPGQGTTISMYFPEVREKVTTEKSKDEEEQTIRGTEVILVVEDEPRVRRVTLRDLKKLGYKTLEAENAAVAKAIIESGEPIDLLFSDILMPGEMDGHMLAVWTEENYPKIKIVLTSGYSKGKADVSRKKAKPFPMIRKPYSTDKLAKQIRTTLSE